MQHLVDTRGNTKIIVICVILFIVIGHFMFDLFGVNKDDVTRRPANWAAKQIRFVSMDATEAEIKAHTDERDGQLQKIDTLITKFQAKKGRYPEDKKQLTSLVRREWPHYLEFRNYNSTQEGYYLTVYDQLMMEEINIPAESSFTQTARGADQTVLIKMVRDPASSRRDKEKAIAQLTDQDVLLEIAKNDKEFSLMRKAIVRITNQSYLKQIYQSKENALVRSDTILQITDKKFLESVAKNAKESKQVREAAIDEITDEYILASIIRSIDRFDLRARAVEKINDEQLLRQFWGDSYPAKVRDVAIRKMALNAKSELARIQAIEKCKDQKILLQIVQESDSTRLKSAAAEKISWKPYLEEIKATETDAYIVGIVSRKLSNY